MPEMIQYCGKRFRVYKRAHKTCDTVSGAYVGRRLPGGIHLEHRCDGEAHGGCQAACLIFWKDAWLKPVDSTIKDASHTNRDRRHSTGCAEEDVWNATKVLSPTGKIERYACQATELLNFTQPLKWWDARQYIEDYISGNASLGSIVKGFAYSLAKRRTLGRPARWLYNYIQTWTGGVPFPNRTGSQKSNKDAPVSDLNLQPGDLVRVKSYEEILATIDSGNQNRGLFFDAEMAPNCGGTYRVKARVEKFIDEQTGRMRKLKTPAVILEGVHCRSRYSDNRLFCPRSIYTWWREVWLEKIADKKEQSSLVATMDGVVNTRN